MINRMSVRLKFFYITLQIAALCSAWPSPVPFCQVNAAFSPCVLDDSCFHMDDVKSFQDDWTPSDDRPVLQLPTLVEPFYWGTTAPRTSGRDAIKPLTEPFLFSGPDGSWINMPLKLCFTLQVECFYSRDTYKSHDWRSFLLPGTQISIFSGFVSWYNICLSILLCSGDAESNPGHDTKAL